MSTVKEPLHPLRTARYLWLGILLCALVGGACFLGGRWSAGRSETTKIDTVILQNQLSEIRELATVTYAYTNMAQFESSNDFYGVKIPFTTKSFILTYDGHRQGRGGPGRCRGVRQRHHGHHHTAGGGDPLPRDR